MTWSHLPITLLIAVIAYTAGWTTHRAVKDGRPSRRWSTRRLELDIAVIEAISDAVAERLQRPVRLSDFSMTLRPADSAATWSKIREEIEEHQRRTGRKV